MRSIDREVFKRRCDEYVRFAEAGETVLVTEHDRVVAELRPPSIDPVSVWNARRAASKQPPLNAFEERGVREGWLTPAEELGPLPPCTEPAEGTLDELLRELAKDREDR